MLFAARNVASREPFEAWIRADGEAARPRSQGAVWKLVSSLVRALLIFLRAIPEYMWAFLLLAMLGPSAWPAVLALAIHNSGILGKLGAETIENLDPRTLRVLREHGATRAQVAVAAILPLSLSRFLLYFFYRFETCVREATVLGMLGVASLGYWIQDSRTRQFYDEMLFFVALGAVIVLGADLVSMLARWIVRRAS
jgi:phosphonate transport system permease protein